MCEILGLEPPPLSCSPQETRSSLKEFCCPSWGLIPESRAGRSWVQGLGWALQHPAAVTQVCPAPGSQGWAWSSSCGMALTNGEFQTCSVVNLQWICNINNNAFSTGGWFHLEDTFFSLFVSGFFFFNFLFFNFFIFFISMLSLLSPLGKAEDSQLLLLPSEDPFLYTLPTVGKPGLGPLWELWLPFGEFQENQQKSIKPLLTGLLNGHILPLCQTFETELSWTAAPRFN